MSGQNVTTNTFLPKLTFPRGQRGKLCRPINFRPNRGSLLRGQRGKLWRWTNFRWNRGSLLRGQRDKLCRRTNFRSNRGSLLRGQRGKLCRRIQFCRNWCSLLRCGGFCGQWWRDLASIRKPAHDKANTARSWWHTSTSNGSNQGMITPSK